MIIGQDKLFKQHLRYFSRDSPRTMLPKHSYASELPGELVTERENEFILNGFPSSDPTLNQKASVRPSMYVCIYLSP